MIQKQREQLENYGISLNGSNANIHFGVGTMKDIVLEQECELRDGKYDVDYIGSFTYLGGGNSIFRNIGNIGRYCSIAPNIFTGPVEHPTDTLSPHPLFQGNWGHRWSSLNKFYNDNSIEIHASKEHYEQNYNNITKIEIGNNVWIGEGAFIKQGVKIGDNSIIAARSLVLNDVEPFSIVGGTPAKIIKYRFDDKIISDLENLDWWNYELSILNGVDFTNIQSAIDQIKINMETSQKYLPLLIKISKDGSINYLNK